MAQNIYDDPAFFAAYGKLPRSQRGLAVAPEWPTLRAMLPRIDGARVLDLGCGYGWFARWARENGAAAVLAVDVSERMLERARGDTGDVAIRYAQADLDHFAVHETFDLAYSSLALHYLENLTALFASVRSALTPGGSLVFSVEHPIYTAPRAPMFLARDGYESWPVDAYLNEGARTTDWLAPGVIKQHRTIGTYLNALIGSGFAIRRVEEWGPSEAQIHEHPEWANERERPAFLLVSAGA